MTDKRGTTFFYGEDADARLVSYRTGDIARWQVQRVVDAFGNQMTFTYVHDSSASGAPGEPWVQIYPAQIDYTSHLTSAGTPDAVAHFHVKFVLDDGSRDDVISSARLGFDTRTRFRLQRVDASFDDQIVRSYHFNYVPGAFSKSLLQSIELFGLDGTRKLTEHSFDYFGPDAVNSFGYRWSGDASARGAGSTTPRTATAASARTSASARSAAPTSAWEVASPPATTPHGGCSWT